MRGLTEMHNWVRMPCTCGILTIRDLCELRSMLEARLEKMRKYEKELKRVDQAVSQEALNRACVITRLLMKLEQMIGPE